MLYYAAMVSSVGNKMEPKTASNPKPVSSKGIRIILRLALAVPVISAAS